MNGHVSSTTVQKLRHSETPCLMITLFDTGASKMEKSSLLVKHKIDIFDNSIANLNVREFFDYEHFRIFSSMTSRVSFICYIHILKLPWNSDNSSIQNIHGQNYMDSAMLSYSCAFEDLCFPFSSLK